MERIILTKQGLSLVKQLAWQGLLTSRNFATSDISFHDKEDAVILGEWCQILGDAKRADLIEEFVTALHSLKGK